MAKVGLTTSRTSGWPSPFARPRTNTVLPAPRSPRSAIRSPARIPGATAAAKASSASGLRTISRRSMVLEATRLGSPFHSAEGDREPARDDLADRPDWHRQAPLARASLEAPARHGEEELEVLPVGQRPLARRRAGPARVPVHGNAVGVDPPSPAARPEQPPRV